MQEREISNPSLHSQYYVHVTVPSIPKAQEEAVEEQVVEPQDFLQLQENYLFWGPSLLVYFPTIERWASADARHFEKAIIYRLRSLMNSEGQTALEQLEVEWIWDEIVRRRLEPEALRAIEQVGIDQKRFLQQRQSFKPVLVNMWAPMKGLGIIALFFLAMAFGFYITYFLIF